MLFVGVIDNDKHKILWCKLIQSLGSMSDTLKMSITTDSLTFKAINSPRTCYGEVKFSKDFFHEFELELEDEEAIEGYDGDAYNLLLNSKHLLTVFRHPDTWEYVCLRINMSSTAQPAARFKLLVEIKTVNLIVKKYQTSYNPTNSTVVEVGNAYDSTLNKQLRTKYGGFTIHSIVMKLEMLKTFLDTTASGTEDFRLNVKPEKIQITAYTRQITRDKEYLKQPMSVSLDIPLSELANTNLDDSIMASFLFRLKELKTFSHLINALSTIDVNYADSTFEILIRNPGEPIVFEAKHKQLISVQFIYLTTIDKVSVEEAEELGYSPASASLSPSLFDLKPFAPTSHKASVSTRSTKETLQKNARTVSATLNAASGSRRTHKFQKTMSDEHVRVRSSVSVFGNDMLPENESEVDHVTHERQSTPDLGGSDSTTKERQQTAKLLGLSESQHTSLKIQVANKQDNLQTNEEYGPTQNNKRPKSILD